MKQRVPLLFLALACFGIGAVLLNSCAKLREPLPQALPKAFLETPVQIYPHSVEFKQSQLHGQIYFSNSQTCEVCHGKDLKGGNSQTPCSRCHENFPHSEEFKASPAHGAEYLTNKENCSQCHQPDQATGHAKTNCNRCHSYPHAASWNLPEQHGKKFLEDRSLEKRPGPRCDHCHDEKSDFKKRFPNLFVSCGSCHFLMPHTTLFKYGEHYKVAGGNVPACLKCHSDYKRLMPNSPNGCKSCHHHSF